MKKLTYKQKRFCQEYIRDWNATRAAIAAGYSEKTAYAIGQENLKKPEILAYVNRVQTDLEKLAQISKLRILEELAKIAFSSIARLHNTWLDRKDFEDLSENERACISEIETRIVKRNIGTKKDPDIVDVEQIKVKLFDKLRAIDAINRLMGYDAPLKANLNVKHDNAARIDEMNENQLNALIHKLLKEVENEPDQNKN